MPKLKTNYVAQASIKFSLKGQSLEIKLPVDVSGVDNIEDIHTAVVNEWDRIAKTASVKISNAGEIKVGIRAVKKAEKASSARA